MRLTPLEEERIAIFAAAELARRVRATGALLNQPEAVALICDAMLMAARTGASYEACVVAGRSAVRETEVIEGVRDLIPEVRQEVLLGVGTRLMVLVDPLGPGPDPVTGAMSDPGDG
jgi:urease subunit gamma/beta